MPELPDTNLQDIVLFSLVSIWQSDQPQLQNTRYLVKCGDWRTQSNSSICSNKNQHQQKLWKSHVQTEIKQYLLTLPVQQQWRLLQIAYGKNVLVFYWYKNIAEYCYCL